MREPAGRGPPQQPALSRVWWLSRAWRGPSPRLTLALGGTPVVSRRALSTPGSQPTLAPRPQLLSWDSSFHGLAQAWDTGPEEASGLQAPGLEGRGPLAR